MPYPKNYHHEPKKASDQSLGQIAMLRYLRTQKQMRYNHQTHLCRLG